LNNENFTYKKVRSQLIDDLRRDLIGPFSETEFINESPLSSYITGILSPADKNADAEQDEEFDDFSESIEQGQEQEVEVELEEEQEKIVKKGFKKQSSMGMTFYVDEKLQEIILNFRWGRYLYCAIEEIQNDEEGDTDHKDDVKDKKGSSKRGWKRNQIAIEKSINLCNIKSGKKISLDDGIYLSVMHYSIIHNTKRMVSVFISNERNTSDNEVENTMFQVELSVQERNGEAVFYTSADSIEQHYGDDDYYYIERQVFARGHGCAAMWEIEDYQKAYRITSSFIPEHEIASVSTELEDISQELLSMKFFSSNKNKDETIKRLDMLSSKYEMWIKSLNEYPFMKKESYKLIGSAIISKCNEAHQRIHRGIRLIEKDDKVYASFTFLNKVMFYQNAIKRYADKNGRGIKSSLKEFIEEDGLNWRPFQIAFILINLEGVSNPMSPSREIVDLLFFPTGGGKTEAYLGLSAFVIGYRRLTREQSNEYEKDGGVTIFLRYTLRLLTTQQRDRLLKMIIACEIIRNQNPKLFGDSEISIGFWVGGNVTPNKFDEFIPKKDDEPGKIEQAYRKLTKQIIKCPYCGTPIQRENYQVHTETSSVDIYCSYSGCYFKNKKLPVYVVDEEIYRKCPTVIISTVDKFARLPWDEKTALLFGKRNRFCERHGNISDGERHESKHNKREDYPLAKVINDMRPFYPPELIIQDELHLITGPLGTIYGGYETAIEELCSIAINGKKILPKYIVSTATIKNAGEQIRCLYGREKHFQFPPQGLIASDSYFSKEIPLKEKPFRQYVGICASGQSMKTTLLRTYAVLIQATKNLEDNEELKGFLDPYHTLVGYFNSTRELGGTVRLLQDDIPKRIKRIKKKYKNDKWRTNIKHKEITSRTQSWQIPQILEQLERRMEEDNCLDVVIATNMIAVGMDVDRLGLMVVTGQPKQSTEYIQASSRVGRKYPGLVVTVYNAYRPRDLSHYENFAAYHSQLYRHVEGTTATPFAARARDRVLHAIVIGLLRLRNKDMALNEHASNIKTIANEVLDEVKQIIMNRVYVVEPMNAADTEEEFNIFIDDWKKLNEEEKKLYYYIPFTDKMNRLINHYNQHIAAHEKATLNSMREVENSATLYYYQEEGC
jgi:hypothetical protein